MPSKGRPFGTSPTLNEKVTTAIAASVANGNYFKTACEANGVPESTAYMWLKKAEKDHAEGPYAEFARAVTQASVEWEQSCVTVIMAEARKGDWRAALEILQRREPDKWGNVQKLKIDSGRLEEMTRGVIQIVKDALDRTVPDAGTRQAALAEILRGLAELGGAGGASALTA
jgi:hypothetical protein